MLTPCYLKTALTSLTLLLFYTGKVYGEEFEVKLKNPTFSKGTLSSTEGGIITGPHLRIQAEEMAYIDKTADGLHIKQVKAKGNLLLEYKGKFFTGSDLDYDLIHQIGILKDARTSTDYWFVGGDTLEIQEDGSFWMSEAYLTTAESEDPWWKLYSSHINLKDSYLLSAKNMGLRFFDFPLLWLPYFKLNLKFLKDSPIRYKFVWDEVLKQKLSIRYELYSTETFALFGRLDYRAQKGPGIAIETNYRSPSSTTVFQTKNYAAHDKVVPDEISNKRYRFQGLLTSSFQEGHTHMHISYDKLSDDKMPQDFKEEEFELGNQKRTVAFISHVTKRNSSRLTLEPKINYFQSINQKLPLLVTHQKSAPLGKTGIIAQNSASMGYLSYTYAGGLSSWIQDFESARVENKTTLYRPFHTGPFSLTPWMGVTGLYYSKPHQTKLITSYGFKLKTALYKRFHSFTHQQVPYIELYHIEPLSSTQTPNPIFSLQDGIVKQTVMRPGITHAFYPQQKTALPFTTFHLYTYLFTGNTPFTLKAPKVYLSALCEYPSWRGSMDFIYNREQQVIDRINTRSAWTVSENVAFSLELRHRSRFDWRKCDHHNFSLDVKRDGDELLSSPLSDRRNTLLSQFHIKLSPLWSCHLESHHGWGRATEKNYNAYEIKVITLLSGKWQMEMGYRYSPSIKEWTFPSIKLMDVKF
ncbi:MAG: hypothetical protein QRY71_02375 [Candidatus Rhabdochlamydia sp.]